AISTVGDVARETVDASGRISPSRTKSGPSRTKIMGLDCLGFLRPIPGFSMGYEQSKVTGANSRARTRTKFDAAGAKLSQKNHLQERQLLRTRGIAALAREFAPVTPAPRSAGPAKPPGGCASPRPLAN